MAFVRRLSVLLALLGAGAIGPQSGCGLPDYTFTDLSGNIEADASGDASSSGGSGGAPPPVTGGAAGAGVDSGSGTGGSIGGTGGSIGGTGGSIVGTGGTIVGTGGGPSVECTTNADCAEQVSRKACDTDTNTCVECVSGGVACPPGLYCAASNHCEIGCTVNSDCVSGGPVPLPDAGGPVEAGAASDGGGDPGTGAADASLDAAVPIVLDGGRLECWDNQCVGCTSEADCSLGTVCDLGRCVNGCAQDTDCPSGFTCCAGTCVDLTDDVDHCSDCGQVCEPPGAIGVCIDMECTWVECQPGFADCEPSEAGCESYLGTDPANCGSCGNVCPAPTDWNAKSACYEGTCALGDCDPNFENCNGLIADGCETNLLSNSASCGACNFQCELDHANETCSGGFCVISNCQSGYKNCDNSPVNGCETAIISDPNNCSDCGFACSLPNANEGCSIFACTVATCEAPSANCDGLPGNGCEVDTSTDVLHCGACNDPCTLFHATTTCSGGACAIVSCDPGWADCNGQAADGCERNTNGDESNCGACGFTCSSNHGTPLCALGACSISCAANYDDCDNDPLTGCETDLRTSVAHCSLCDNDCPAGPGETANCVNGLCGISSCGNGAADCDGSPGNGCEVSTNSDVFNCGGCGQTCSAPHATSACTAGACTVQACESGWGNCDGTASNGCETRLNTLSHCGACNTACALPNASASCSTGTCELSFCVPPFGNCDLLKNNGCEVNTLTSVQNCGACGNACSTNHGSAACNSGSCTITCNAGYGNCNASASDGCEKPTTNDVANCGGCGTVCAVQHGTPGCSGATCTVASCSDPFANCDGQYDTGCETNTSDNEAHCGACGASCTLPNVAASSCVTKNCVIDACTASFDNCDNDDSNGCEATPCP